MSLKAGIFPETWKKSYLVPIFKSGKKSDVRNYRGIAVISCIPKLFEAIINQKLFSQIKNRITTMQHGFFEGRSTSTNLIDFVSYSLNAMDNGNHVVALYTDFSKAFDRIDIRMLLFKLLKIGIEPKLLEWLESYLTNRVQIIKFNEKKSHPIQVTSGVPQGSHLGPLLFILYVNDISIILNKIRVLIYADDIKLFLEIKKPEDISIFHNEIQIFHTWCKKGLLELNIKKCNSIVFCRKRHTPNIVITLGNEIVKKCEWIRDLGVILDSKLTFIDHYNAIIHKANNMLSFIKRFGYNFQDPYTIKTLYTAYVRPILEYCIIVWSPYQIKHQQRIESVQKQFLIYALRRLNWTVFPLPSYESRCKLLHLETLQYRRDFAHLSFVNDIISQRIKSTEILEKLTFRAPSRFFINRHHLFSIKFYNTDYAKNQPMNRLMSIYNKYCETVDITMSKEQLKKVLLNEQIRTLNNNNDH